MNNRYQLFISCASALEPLLVDELHLLGIKNVYVGYRGVFVENWDWETIYRINYASRLASRVLLPLNRFRCFDRASLYRNASEINWMNYLKRGQTFAIDSNVHHRELRNSLFASQVVKDAICDQIKQKTGQRPSVQVQNPDVQINLFIQQQIGVISLDTSGEPLHKRSYRQESTVAPIQESLAAALLQLAHYQADRVFLDPCCGSGTLLIEAALIASKTAPGYLRKRWGFMSHPEFDQIKWLQVKNRLDKDRIALVPQRLFGIDSNPKAVQATKINLKAAGFAADIQVEQADFRNFSPSIAPDFILTNPPHGRRLDEEEQLSPLYRALGDFMKHKSKKPASGYIFTSNLNLTKEIGLTAKKRHVLSNGGIDSRLMEYELY
jgi:putative N6-adenine-specific DNA methylase